MWQGKEGGLLHPAGFEQIGHQDASALSYLLHSINEKSIVPQIPHAQWERKVKISLFIPQNLCMQILMIKKNHTKYNQIMYGTWKVMALKNSLLLYAA